MMICNRTTMDATKAANRNIAQAKKIMEERRAFRPPIRMIAKAEYGDAPLHLPDHKCAPRIRFYSDGLVMDDWAKGGVRAGKLSVERTLSALFAAWSNDH